jgi:putative endonuclease
MSGDARHRLGTAGEQLAAQHLQRRGLVIVDRNYRTRWGELDIVAVDGRAIVFCEVKTRRASARNGGPLEAVTPDKQARVRKMAASWLRERGRGGGRERPYASALRFDAIGITVDATGALVSLEHLEGAF